MARLACCAIGLMRYCFNPPPPVGQGHAFIIPHAHGCLSTPSHGAIRARSAIAVYQLVNSMRTIGELLDRAGMARYRIARRAGISPSTLILWERDGIPPKRIDVYTRLAQVLGVDPRELLELANGGDTRE
jgi:DNA-binding XRE family transcriptional regulator